MLFRDWHRQEGNAQITACRHCIKNQWFAQAYF